MLKCCFCKSIVDILPDRQPENETERHGETGRDTERQGETLKDGERHTETGRDIKRQEETQRDRERQKTGRDTERKEKQRDTERQIETQKKGETGRDTEKCSAMRVFHDNHTITRLQTLFMKKLGLINSEEDIFYPNKPPTGR